MHRLPNQSIVRRYRFVAFLLIARWILLVSSVFLFIGADIVGRRDLLWVALGMFAAAGAGQLACWVLARCTKCPLCFVPPFSQQHHLRNSRAESLMGSYPLKVAVTVVCRGNFRCPSCGESTVLQARQGRQPLPQRGF